MIFPEHTWTVVFYLSVILFVFFNRKRFEIHGKIVALYRMKKGVRLMERIGRRHANLVILLGYIGTGVGFVAMGAIVVLLLKGLYDFFFITDALPTLSPVLPGVPVPGGIFIPLVQGMLAIFIVAVVHEFSHGVVAAAHKVKIKNAGPAIFGPFFGAFVEPDEKQLKKTKDIVQYSMFAAGSFSNMLLAGVFFILLFFALSPLIQGLYPANGVMFGEVESPANVSGVEAGVRYVEANGVTLNNAPSLITLLQSSSPNDTLLLIDEYAQERTITLGAHPNDATRGYIGVRGVETSFEGKNTVGFTVLHWLFRLFSLIVGLSLGIGLANLLPVGPLDGGRMFLLAMQQLYGTEKGQKIWAGMSFGILILILVLLWPILSAVGSSLLGIVTP